MPSYCLSLLNYLTNLQKGKGFHLTNQTLKPAYIFYLILHDKCFHFALN